MFSTILEQQLSCVNINQPEKHQMHINVVCGGIFRIHNRILHWLFLHIFIVIFGRMNSTVKIGACGINGTPMVLRVYTNTCLYKPTLPNGIIVTLKRYTLKH